MVHLVPSVNPAEDSNEIFRISHVAANWQWQSAPCQLGLGLGTGKTDRILLLRNHLPPL